MNTTHDTALAATFTADEAARIAAVNQDYDPDWKYTAEPIRPGAYAISVADEAGEFVGYL